MGQERVVWGLGSNGDRARYCIGGVRDRESQWGLMGWGSTTGQNQQRSKNILGDVHKWEMVAEPGCSGPMGHRN